VFSGKSDTAVHGPGNQREMAVKYLKLYGLFALGDRNFVLYFCQPVFSAVLIVTGTLKNTFTVILLC